jgi:phosphatidylserine/phosphatidylglycerophosphate/cardiolipin synthase-like enzyme
MKPLWNPFTPEFGNQIAILNQGDIALKWRIYLTRNARKSIDVQTFIWSNDECGKLVLNELIQAAHRGVKIRILIDHIASDKDPETLAFVLTQSPNIEIKYYRPVGKRLRPHMAVNSINTLVFPGRVNQRMHNKLFIVDDGIAITGGRNYKNHYYNRSSNLNFKDRDLAVLGPAVQRARRSFDEYWNYKFSISAKEFFDINQSIQAEKFAPVDDLEDKMPTHFPHLDRDVQDNVWIKENIIDLFHPVRRIRHIADAPGKNRSWLSLNFRGGGRVTKIITDLIGDANEEVMIQSPYVVVNRRSQKVFKKLKKKPTAPEVIISTNSFAAADHIVTYAANYRLRAKYIERLEFKIFEYRPDPADLTLLLPEYDSIVERVKKNGEEDLPYLSIHGKTFVFDNKISYVGTYNLDPRSENLNTENGFVIDDPVVTAMLRDDILRDIAPENSWVIAKKKIPLSDFNDALQELSSLSPIDIWPFRNTSSFELIPGQEPVPTDHEAFYDRYRDIGDFPGADGLSQNEIMTQFYKTFGKIITPAL